MAKIGNLGLTIIAVIIAITSILWFSNNQMITISSIIVLLSLVGVDIWGMYESDRLVKNISKQYKYPDMEENKNTENLTNENTT